MRSRSTPARRTRKPPLTLTQRVERLERHYFAQRSPNGQRFIVDGDTIRDATTGLQWTRGNVGDKALSWAEAQKACAALTLNGHKDWRLPTLQELVAIADYGRTSPCMDPVFKCDSAWYWTETPHAASPADYAWVVGFNDGYSGWDGQDGGYLVRAVRAGQS